MQINVLKSKLHRATVTDGNVDYEGSIGISRELMDAVGFLPYEKVLVADLNNGNRLETYIIVEEEPGMIVMNGAAAHLVDKGDRVIIMSFTWLTGAEAHDHRPRVAVLDEENTILNIR